MGVKIKATSELKLNDSPVNILMALKMADCGPLRG